MKTIKTLSRRETNKLSLAELQKHLEHLEAKYKCYKEFLITEINKKK